MYFLIGLGIILVIVYANSLYDYLKARKAKKEETMNQELSAVNEIVTASENASDAGVGNLVSDGILPALHSGQGIALADIIEGKLINGQSIFGLPLKLCEKDETGKIIALDREDNIYVIETNLRSQYEDFGQQVKADMKEERRRIQKGADERKVYGIVCVNQPSELLMAVAKKESRLRIYRFDISFENIY